METKTAKKTSKKKKQRMSTGKFVILTLLVIVLGLGGTMLYLQHDQQVKEERRQEIIHSSVFHEGVSVGGVSLGSMTLEEARAALKSAEEALIQNVGFTFVLDGEATKADASFFDISFNTEEQLEQALGLARSGELEALELELESIKSEGRSYDISYTIAPNGKFETLLSSLASERYIAPTEASYKVRELPMHPENGTKDVRNVGLPADGSVTDLRDLRFEFFEGQPGRGIDTEAVLASVRERTEKRQFGEIDLVVTSIPPTVTVDMLKEHLVLRSEASTSFARGHYDRTERVFNIVKATGYIYATELQPGEVFSSNDIIGDRTTALGWQDAPAIVEAGAASEDQPGGGVCQVSTTLYNAVLKGDLKIEYRRAHSTQLSYVAGGLDATINSVGNRIDFTWSNNTASPLYVFTWVDTKDKRIHAEIYGEPFPDEFDSIELKSELIETLEPGPAEFRVDNRLSPMQWWVNNEAKKGYAYETTALYKKDGKVVKTVPIANTVYGMHAQRVYVWPDFVSGTALLPEYNMTKHYQQLKAEAAKNKRS